MQVASKTGPHRQATLQIGPSHQRVRDAPRWTAGSVSEGHKDILGEAKNGKLRLCPAAHPEEDDIGSAVVAEFIDRLEIGMSVDLLPQQPAKPR